MTIQATRKQTKRQATKRSSIDSILGLGIPAMVFDVESIGLHGEGFAVGYVVIHGDAEIEAGLFACPSSKAQGAASDRLWVSVNIPHIQPNCPDPFTVREKFWRRWQELKAKGAMLAADCGWPVEARFLIACVDAIPSARKCGGPYPFVEISSVILASGHDPLEPHERLATETPAHDPVADARQSARLLMEALKIIHKGAAKTPVRRRRA